MNKITKFFDWLEEITYKKSPTNSFTDEDWSKFSSFLIHRYISMNPDYLEVVNEIQLFSGNDKKQIYAAYRDILPKQKQWLKYIGSKKSESENTNIKHLAKYFECSEKEASEYANLIGEEGVQYYIQKMGINELSTTKKKKK